MKQIATAKNSQTKLSTDMTKLGVYGLMAFGVTLAAAVSAFLVILVLGGALNGLAGGNNEPDFFENIYSGIGILMFLFSPLLGVAMFIKLARDSRTPTYTTSQIAIAAVVTLLFTSTVVWVPALLNYKDEQTRSQLNERRRQARNPVTKAQLVEKCKTLDPVQTRRELRPYATIVIEKGSDSQRESTQRIMNRLGSSYQDCIDGSVLVDTAIRNHQTNINTLKSYVSQIK